MGNTLVKGISSLPGGLSSTLKSLAELPGGTDAPIDKLKLESVRSVGSLSESHNRYRISISANPNTGTVGLSYRIYLPEINSDSIELSRQPQWRSRNLTFNETAKAQSKDGSGAEIFDVLASLNANIIWPNQPTELLKFYAPKQDRNGATIKGLALETQSSDVSRNYETDFGDDESTRSFIKIDSDIKRLLVNSIGAEDSADHLNIEIDSDLLYTIRPEVMTSQVLESD